MPNAADGVSQTVGFNIGWDMGVYGRPPLDSVPPEVRKGYLAARDRPQDTKKPDRFVRKWLQLRLNAYLRGKTFDEAVTPEYLKEMTPKRCPVLGIRLTRGTGQDSDWSVDRLDNELGYMPGNVVVMSTRANSAKGDMSIEQIERIAASHCSYEGLTADQWQHLYDVVKPARLLSSPDAESGLQILTGKETIVRGVPMAPLAALQYAMTLDMQNGSGAAFFIIDTTIAAPSGRRSLRALKSLFKQMSKRRHTYAHNLLGMWSSPRLGRAFVEWIRTVDLSLINNALAQLGTIACGLTSKTKLTNNKN